MTIRAMDDADRLQAVQRVELQWPLHLFWARLPRERLLAVADIVFTELPSATGKAVRNLKEPITPQERSGLVEHCRRAVEHDADYPKIKGAFPVWILAIVLKVVIGFLIDYWFTKQSYVVLPHPFE